MSNSGRKLPRDSSNQIVPYQPVPVSAEQRQKQTRLLVLAMLSSNLFGLFVGLILQSLSLRGIVSEDVSRLVLLVSWVIGSVLACIFIWASGTKRKIGVAIGNGILLAILLMGLDRWASSKQAHNPVTREDFSQIIHEQLQEAFNHKVLKMFESLPGFSLQSVTRLHQLPQSRQYLFETADGSLSLYMTTDMLTLMVRDSDGEPYPFRVPLGRNGVPWEKFIYLSCQLGAANNSTVFRVLVNGTEVTVQELPFRIDIPFNDSSLVVGADSNGHNGSKIDISDFAFYGRTLGADEIEAWANSAVATKRNNFVEFSGKQWMRRGKDRNLHQGDNSLTPTFRIGESGN